jgi:hypothetical protein
MRTAHSLLRLVSILLDLAQDALQFLLLGTRSSSALKAENIFLRKQLALYLEREAKSRRATDATRLSMVLLSRLFAWQDALINIKPETFLGWHRKSFQLLWRWKSRPRGRPRVPRQLRELIFKMAHQNQNLFAFHVSTLSRRMRKNSFPRRRSGCEWGKTGHPQCKRTIPSSFPAKAATLPLGRCRVGPQWAHSSR